eukprot:snap_masked-scaffold_7-processed-gene-15.12-mRNA-1 protein AED:0.10 eAED:0.10 QI:0/-1/0/1/-1/1/1/0/232
MNSYLSKLLLETTQPSANNQMSLTTWNTELMVSLVSLGFTPSQASLFLSQIQTMPLYQTLGLSQSSFSTTDSLCNKLNSFETPDIPGKRKLNETTTPKKRARTARKKKCSVPNCTKFSQGGTARCVAHGGGKRCSHPGCPNGARGSSMHCISHGGGKRCSHPGCPKSAVGATSRCVMHGGGRRCVHLGCTKSAQGRSNRCVAHGGGNRCSYPNCRYGARGSTKFCKTHGNMQ